MFVILGFFVFSTTLGRSCLQLVQGLPFDLHDALQQGAFDDGMHDSGPSSTHEMNLSDNDDAVTNAFSLPPGPARNLSAQGAAQVLYTIARADTDTLGAAGSDSGVLVASQPRFALSPLSATTDGAAGDGANDGMNAECDGLDADLLTASSAPPHNPDMHVSDSASAVRPDCTADGVPVNSIMGGAVPMMVPWGSLQAPAGMQMLQPGPNGLVPVSHGTQNFLPVQLRAMDGGSCDEMAVDTTNGGYSLVVPPELMTQQLVFSADDMLQCVDAEGQPLGLPVLQMPDSPSMQGFVNGAETEGHGGCVPPAHAVLPGLLAGPRVHTACERHSCCFFACRIPQEQFLAAIRNTSRTEVSATS